MLVYIIMLAGTSTEEGVGIYPFIYKLCVYITKCLQVPAPRREWAFAMPYVSTCRDSRQVPTSVSPHWYSRCRRTEQTTFLVINLAIIHDPKNVQHKDKSLNLTFGCSIRNLPNFKRRMSPKQHCQCCLGLVSCHNERIYFSRLSAREYMNEWTHWIINDLIIALCPAGLQEVVLNHVTHTCIHDIWMPL